MSPACKFWLCGTALSKLTNLEIQFLRILFKEYQGVLRFRFDGFQTDRDDYTMFRPKRQWTSL